MDFDYDPISALRKLVDAINAETEADLAVMRSPEDRRFRDAHVHARIAVGVAKVDAACALSRHDAWSEDAQRRSRRDVCDGVIALRHSLRRARAA